MSLFLKKDKIFLLLGILTLCFFSGQMISAGVDDNVSGWAWSENIGWISFNSTTGGGATDYGVDIDSSSGVFSGYAWSENIGWISFNEAELVGCPVDTCQAKLDGLTDEVSGWARALNYGDGWEGWIRLRDTSYGVSWNSGNQEMEGWAWSDGVVGWISFNCVNQGVCATSNYKVIASFAGVDDDPPTVSVICPATCTLPECSCGAYGPSGAWQAIDSKAEISCSDTGTGCDADTYRFRAYSSDPGTCSTDYGTYSLSSPYTVSSYNWFCGAAKDLNGNAGFSIPIEYKVDQTQPNSQIQSPSAGSWHADDFSLDTLDEDLQSGLDSSSCEYKVLSYDCYPPGPSCEYSTGWLERVCNTSAQNITVGPGGNCPFEGSQSCWAYVRSQDNVGNLHSPSEGNGSIKYYNLDWTEPLVGEISPLIATQGVNTTFTASLNDPIGRISGCWFYIGGQFEKAVDSILPVPCENGEDCTVSVDHQFLSTGDYGVRFSCRDAADNVAWGDSVTVSVIESHAPIITSLDYYSCHSSTPEQECTDQFSCCTEPTTQTDCDVKFNISAYDPDANPLTYTWDFDDGTPDSNDEDPSHHYTSANTYNVLVDVFNGTEHTQDTLVVAVNNPSISVGLTADPSFGTDTLENVDLRAIVSGSMYGTINYKFDCTNDASWELEVSNQSTDDYTAVDVCSYLTPASYTAKTFVQRGTGSAEDTVNINVVDSECTPGEQTDCTSVQGCSHTITCQENGTWPSCPSDECTIDDTQSCGVGGTQTCTDSCVWDVCTEEGECEPGPDCPDCLCSPDTCVGQDYYDYPDFGDCTASYTCDTGVETGQPCEPNIITDDPQCNVAPVCDSLGAIPDQGVAPLDVSLTGSAHDDDGTISQYGFIFGDGDSSTTSESSISHIYNDSGIYCAKLRVQDNDGTWSSIPGDCPDVCTKQINISENDPPVADVSCDASGCGAGSACNGSWIAYNRNCQFYFLNDSTDPNSTNPPDDNNDIIKSTWSIFYEGGTPWQDPYVICTDNSETPENEGMCDLLMPALPASQSYYVTLTVEDVNGATDSYSKNFYVRREIAADFQCSLSLEEGWQSCNGFVASEEELIYFQDISIQSEGSTGISSWSWIFEDGTPSISNLQNPSASFMNIDANSGAVALDAVDNMGRTDTEQYQLQITIPLPEWYEVVPF